MRRVFMIMIIILCMFMLGCGEVDSKSSNTQTGKNSEEDNVSDSEGEEKKIMTEQQETVFRSYGLSEEEIERMKKEGMDYKEQSFVDTAVIMLNYLEEKYGQRFQVIGGDIPGILSGDYWITAKAMEGEYAGEKFDVYYRGQEGCTDGYMKILKQEEASEALENLILEKYPDVQVFASMEGEYGNEITLDMTGEQLLHVASYYVDIVITAPDMSEAEFNKKAEEIEKYIDKYDVFSSGSVICFINPMDSSTSYEEFAELVKSNSESNPVYKWSYYLSTR